MWRDGLLTDRYIRVSILLASLTFTQFIHLVIFQYISDYYEYLIFRLEYPVSQNLITLCLGQAPPPPLPPLPTTTQATTPVHWQQRLYHRQTTWVMPATSTHCLNWVTTNWRTTKTVGQGQIRGQGQLIFWHDSWCKYQNVVSLLLSNNLPQHIFWQRRQFHMVNSLSVIVIQPSAKTIQLPG